MLRTLVLVALALVASGGSFAEDSSGQAILDFRRPPSQLFTARLVELNGRAVNAPVSRTSFWVDPGVHEIVVAAAINDSMQVGTISRRRREQQGSVTIEVEAGKRYRIAAQVTNPRGEWRPVIWGIEDVQ